MQHPVYTLFLRFCVYIFADLVHRDVLTLLVYGAKQMIAMREGEGGRETDRERRRGGEREGKEEERGGGRKGGRHREGERESVTPTATLSPPELLLYQDGQR